MAVPHDTPGAGDGTQVVAEAIEDTSSTSAAVDVQAASDPTPEAAATAGGEAEEPTGGTETAVATAEDDADLAQYPEAVREQFKSLTPAQRKSLYEQAEARVEEKIRTERERNDKLEAERKQQDERRKEIRTRTGKFVGLEGQTIELPNGNQITLPSYDELVQKSQTQRGRDELSSKYGMHEDDAEFWRFIYDWNRDSLDASAEVLDDRAWGKLDQSLKDGMRAEGLDPDRILDGAQNPHDIVRQLVGHLKGEHDAVVKKLTTDYEGRIHGLNLNAEGMRGQLVGATSREPLPGGRTSAGGEMTLAAFRALPLEERKAMRRDNPSLVDRLYAAG